MYLFWLSCSTTSLCEGIISEIFSIIVSLTGLFQNVLVFFASDGWNKNTRWFFLRVSRRSEFILFKRFSWSVRKIQKDAFITEAVRWTSAGALVRLVCSGSLPQDVVRFHTAVLVAGAHDRDTQWIDRHDYLKFDGVREGRRELDSKILLRSADGRKWRMSCAAA